jgi:hypothetical protein
MTLETSMKQVAVNCFFLGLFFDPEDRGDMFLHGVVSQNTGLFRTTAVITSCTPLQSCVV